MTAISMRAAPLMREHDLEPVRGLPERLPAGESILWQGAPDWLAFARHAMHLRLIALYCAAVLIYTAVSAASSLSALHAAAMTALVAMALCAGGIGIVVGFAWLVARTTVYTITNRRVVMRIGVALSMTINLPFAQIATAGLRRHADGTGDIAIAILPPARIAALTLWPHTRPWRLRSPEPSLRALADAEGAARVLARALAASASLPVPALDGANAGAFADDRHAAAAA